jgi:hypothetical protein
MVLKTIFENFVIPWEIGKSPDKADLPTRSVKGEKYLFENIGFFIPLPSLFITRVAKIIKWSADKLNTIYKIIENWE